MTSLIGRRKFIGWLGGAAGLTLLRPLPARAQRAAGNIAHVGIIDDSPNWEPFRQQLHELHYIEGRNVIFAYQRADGVADRLDAAAMALAQVPVDVIAVFGTPAARAAQRATKTIPIVAMSIGDPVAAGLVTSLAHPDGNITGNTILGAEIVTKRLQLLKDAVPAVARVAFLWNPDNASSAAIFAEMQKSAPLFHMTLISLPARTAEDFDRVFAQLVSDRPDALLATNDPLHQAHMAAVIDFLLQHRIAGLFQVRENVLDGGLMSYGVSFPDLFREGALYVDKILHGAKPSDLPIAQPVTFELIVNMKTAKALGLEIPTALLARADEVIE
jgi:putative ABC transport system substrate-binding protein